MLAEVSIGPDWYATPVALSGPNHGCRVRDEVASHSSVFIAHLEMLDSRSPIHLQRNCDRITCPILQRVQDVEIVFHLKILDCKGRPSRTRTAVVQTRIEVMNLIAEIGSLRSHV